MANPFDVAEASMGTPSPAGNPFDVAEKAMAVSPAPATRNPFDVAEQSRFKLPADNPEVIQAENPGVREGMLPGTSLTQSLLADPVFGIDKDSPASMPLAPLNALGNILRAAVSDASTTLTGHPELGGNLRAIAREEPLPADKILSDISGQHPYIAAAGKTGQGVIASAPMMAMGMPEGIMGRLAAAGFTAQAIEGAHEAVQTIETEMSKPPGERDADKLTSAWSAFAQSGVAPFMGAHSVKGAGEYFYKKAAEYAPRGTGFNGETPPAPIVEYTKPPDEQPVQPTQTPPDAPHPIIEKIDNLAAQVADLQATLRGNLPKPDQSSIPVQSAKTSNLPNEQVQPVRTPDGQVDPVQTAIEQLRAKAPEPTPSEQSNGVVSDALPEAASETPAPAGAANPFDVAENQISQSARPTSSGFKPPAMPERFDTLEDALKYREAYKAAEVEFYKSLGLTEAEAHKFWRAGDNRSNVDTSNLEAKLTPENLARLDKFSTGEGAEMYQWDRQYNPEELLHETDKAELARHAVQNLARESNPSEFGDKMLHASVSLRKLKEAGGTWSDIARQLDQHTTRISSSQGDKAEVFKMYGQKIREFAKQQGIDLPQGDLKRLTPELEGAKRESAAPAETITGQNGETAPDATGSKARKQMPAEGVKSPKGRGSFFLRPRSDGVPDILDHIQELGGIRPPGESVGGEYDSFREAMTGPARLLVRKGAKHTPDTIINELRDTHGTHRIQTPDHLYNAIQGAVKQRERLRTLDNAGKVEGKQTTQFQQRIVAGQRPKKEAGTFVKVPANRLLEGDQFEAQGHKFEVEHLEFDDANQLAFVQVKDGPKFGVQRVGADEFLHIDKGTFAAGPEHDGRPIRINREALPGGEYSGIALNEGDGGFSFDAPESVADQKARLAADKRKADEARAKQQMLDKAKARLTGGDVDRNDEMFGREVLTDKAGQHSLFDKPAPSEQESPHVPGPTRDIPRRLQPDPFARWSHPAIRIDDRGAIESYRSAYEHQLQEARADAQGYDVEEITRAIAAVRNELIQEHTIDRSRRARLLGRATGLMQEEVKFHSEPSIADKAKALADSLESLKSGIRPDQLHAFGLAADLWDRAVSAAQAAIRAGGTVAEAIEAAIQHIKDNFKGRFNEAGVRQFLARELPKDNEKPERERTFEAVKGESEQALSDLQQATKRQPTQTQGEYKQAAAVAGAKYRTLREELLNHPDYVADQVQRQHEAITEANAILKPHDMAMRPEEYPNPATIADKLTPDQAKRVFELQAVVDQTHRELQQMSKKLVDRVTGQMIDDGRLPNLKPMPATDAGRTLGDMTDFLKANKIDSPTGTFRERLALGKKFADRYQNAKDGLKRAWLNSIATWKAAVETFKHPTIDDDFRKVIKSWASYDQTTANDNYQYAKAITDKVKLPVRRQGIAVWLDAEGDRGLLQAQSQQIPEKYSAIWKAALNLTADEQRVASQIKANFEAKLEDAVNVGLVNRGRDSYIPQRWKVKPEMDNDATDPFGEAKQGSPGNPFSKLDPRDPFFSFQRETPTYFDGIMAKGEPENLDVAHLVSVYDEAFHKALSSRGAIAALQDATARDGMPVVKISGKASAANDAEGGKAYFVDSKSRSPGDTAADGRPYRSVDHFALRDWKIGFKDEKGNPIIVKGDMLIHPDHYDFLKNELETPRWTQKGLGRVLLAANSFLKSSKFIGPFHIVTEALHASFHGVVPSVHGFELDLKDPKQALLNRSMTLGFGRAREMFEEGLSSHGGIWAKVPGLGDAVVKMNNFTFSEYIPRLKMKVGLAVLDRNIARYKEKLSMEQIGELTGRQMDAAFGGQNWRLMGANKNTLAVARLALVAPDFLLSRAKVIGQAFKPYNKEQRVFLLAQAAGVYALCRVLNSVFSDDNDPHFEFKNWDSVVIGKRAYHARFIVSDAANLARDLMGLGSFNQNGVPFITGRLGAIPKAVIEAGTGKDLFTGQNKDGLFDASNPVLKAFSIVAKDVSEWMTPMFVDGYLGGAAKGQTGPGQVGAALFGVSSRKESAASEIYNLAADYNRKSKDAATVRFQKERDNSTHPESAYRTLDNLLDAGKLEAAQKAYDALVADGHTTESIESRYGRNTAWTGNQTREKEFISSLTPAQRKVYDAAVQEREARQTAFKQLKR